MWGKRGTLVEDIIDFLLIASVILALIILGLHSRETSVNSKYLVNKIQQNVENQDIIALEQRISNLENEIALSKFLDYGRDVMLKTCIDRSINLGDRVKALEEKINK